MYHTLIVNGKEYKLKLDAKGIIALEKRLKRSPLDMFMAAQNGQLPLLGELLLVLHASLQKLQSGITEDKVYDIYDEYIESGQSYTDLIPEVLEVFKASGFFREEELETKN